MSIIDKLVTQHAVEHLNHTTDHFPNLIVQKGLSLEVKSDELNSIWVIRVCDFECLFVHIHVFTCFHFNHESLCGHLMSFNVFCVVVIFVSSDEVFPLGLQLVSLLLCKAS